MTHYPYSSRKEHDYVNEMTVVIAKARLVIKEANNVIDQLQSIVEEHIEITKNIRQGDNNECKPEANKE